MEQYEQYITAIAILLSAIIGACTAGYAVWRQRRIAALRSTLQFAVEREVHDQYWVETRRTAEKALDDPTHDKRFWVTQITKTKGPELEAVRTMVNHYELVSQGIEQKIIDGPFYAECVRTIFVRVWKNSKHYIQAARAVSKHDLTLSGFDKLGKQWNCELEVIKAQAARARSCSQP